MFVIDIDTFDFITNNQIKKAEKIHQRVISRYVPCLFLNAFKGFGMDKLFVTLSIIKLERTYLYISLHSKPLAYKDIMLRNGQVWAFDLSREANDNLIIDIEFFSKYPVDY